MLGTGALCLAASVRSEPSLDEDPQILWIGHI